MKKIFTLFAVAMLGLCASAEVNPEYGPCPSVLSYSILDAEDPANITFELMLTNPTSHNLNGFNMQIKKQIKNEDGTYAYAENLAWKRAQGLNWFSAKGYAPNLLGCLSENMGMEFTDEELEAMLSDMADVKSNAKNTTDGQELVIIEILTTNECRFFPIFDAPTPIGIFKIDMSACEDGLYRLIALDEPSYCSFSYTGGPEPLTSWTTDEPVEIVLEKTGDVVKEYTAINSITVDQPTDNRIFDLQGRELQSVPEHGIYIQNGKKYVK